MAQGHEDRQRISFFKTYSGSLMCQLPNVCLDLRHICSYASEWMLSGGGGAVGAAWRPCFHYTAPYRAAVAGVNEKSFHFGYLEVPF